MIENGVIAGDLETLREYVIYATSTTAVKMLDEDDTTELLWEDPMFSTKEAYVYYDSLYALYYKWMEAYGFKPAEKKEDK